MTTTIPLIAIVGRPNVGKSTLFNRLIGRRHAIVALEEGTTRDRVYGSLTWRGLPLRLVDTGGFDLRTQRHELGEQVQRQLRRAVQEAHYLLVVCDVQRGLVPMDEMIIQTLRKTGKPMALIANKADHCLSVPADCYIPGFDTSLAVSALHGHGTGDLLDHLVERMAGIGGRTEGEGRTASGSQPMSCAIVGRPNVGKSSLLNAVLQEERVVVSNQPGTTRDAIDTLVQVRGEPMVLIDTAGLKHRRKVATPVETFAMSRSMDAISRCDVALVVLDGIQGILRDDKMLVERVVKAGRGMAILVNKWDLVTRVTKAQLVEVVHRRLPASRFAPVLPISAKTGFGIGAALTTAQQIMHRMRGVPDEELYRMLERAWAARRPPRVRGRPVRCRGVRWLGGRPARVELQLSPVAKLPTTYERYLLNQLALWRRLQGVSVQLVLQRSEVA